MADERPSHEMSDLERELRALVPRSSRIDFGRMMYLAGQASLSPVPPQAPTTIVPPLAARGPWLWPLSTAIMATVAAWLGVMLTLSHYQAASAPSARSAPPDPPASRTPDAANPQDLAGSSEVAATQGTHAGVGVPLESKYDEVSTSVQYADPQARSQSYGQLTRRVLDESKPPRKPVHGSVFSNWLSP